MPLYSSCDSICMSGETYQDYVKNHVLEPAGVHAMYIGTTQLGHQGPREVTYYDPSGAPLVNSVFPGDGQVPVPYGDLNCSIQPAEGRLVRRFVALYERSGWKPDVSRAARSTDAAANDREPRTPWAGPIDVVWIWHVCCPSPSRWWHLGLAQEPRPSSVTTPPAIPTRILANTNTIDPTSFAPALEDAVKSALDTDFVGSEADLFSQFPSEAP